MPEAEPTHRSIVYQWRDFAERVGWTAIQFAAGAFIAWVQSGDPWSWRTFVYGVAVAMLKVLIAQNAGDHNDGSAWPGGVQKQ